MTKKKVKFQEVQKQEDDEDDHSTTTKGNKSRRFKEKHSIDSDEDLECEDGKSDDQENILHDDDIEGQEDETIRNDEGITVTPFNLKDELEEGHFDAQGNYIANKDKDDVTDEWLESVDWNKVKYKSYPKKEEQIEVKEPVLEPLKIMQDMISIMRPGENVLKCLRRLGGNKKPVSSADRWKKKKMLVEEPMDEKTVENKANLLKLTGLADDLLQGGDFQIYEKTHEQLSYEIKSKLSQFQDADEDDELESAYKKPKLDNEQHDMKKEEKVETKLMSDDDDELEAAFNKSESMEESTVTKEKLPAKNTEMTRSDATISLCDEISWIYKLEDNDGGEHLGPFTSLEMLKMQESGKFGDGVYCRKVNVEGSFYNSKRIDFDLYT